MDTSIAPSNEPIPPEPIKFIVIDPGTANLASICGTYDPDVDLGKIKIVLPRDRMLCEHILDTKACGTFDMVRDLKKWADQRFWREFNKNCLVIIEQQYITPPEKNVGVWATTLRLQKIESTLFTLFHAAYQMFTTLLPSSKYKKGLGIATGQHKDNKQEALGLAKQIVGDKYEKYIDNDHVADCICMLYYYLKYHHERSYKKDFFLEFEIVDPLK